MKRILPNCTALVLAGLTALNGCSDNSTGSSSTALSNAGASTTIASTKASTPLPDGLLSASDLVAYAKYRLTYVPPDEFTKDPSDDALNGRKFHLEIKGVGDGIDAPLGSVPLRTTYDVDKETLDLTVDASSAISSSESDVINYLTIYEDDQNQPPEMMSNAFGVQKEITYIKKLKLGVGSVGRNVGVFKPIPHDNGFVFDLSKTIHADVEKAKKSNNRYIIIVDGGISKDAKGKTVNCYHDKEDPSLDKTYPADETACVINAKLRSIFVLDPERHVLAQWGAP